VWFFYSLSWTGVALAEPLWRGILWQGIVGIGVCDVAWLTARKR